MSADNHTTSSFWARPEMQARLAKTQARLENSPSETPLKNLNYKKPTNLSSPEDHGSSSKQSNLKNLKASEPKKRGGVPRLKLYTDETLKKALAWGVEEWLVQVCIREYGEYTVKGQINRIHQIPEGYFKPKYGAIPTQRGRLFNLEMQKLKAKTSASL